MSVDAIGAVGGSSSADALAQAQLQRDLLVLAASMKAQQAGAQVVAATLSATSDQAAQSSAALSSGTTDVYL